MLVFTDWDHPESILKQMLRSLPHSDHESSVCHVRSETGGDRSGGRTMKMSFIQAERDSGKNKIESNNTKNNLVIMYSKPTKPYDTKCNYNSCIERCPPAVLIMLSWLRNKGSPGEVLEMSVFLLPAVSERPCRPPNSGSLSVSSWLLPPRSGFRAESGWSVSSRQSWRFDFKN